MYVWCLQSLIFQIYWSQSKKWCHDYTPRIFDTTTTSQHVDKMNGGSVRCVYITATATLPYSGTCLSAEQQLLYLNQYRQRESSAESSTRLETHRWRTPENQLYQSSPYTMQTKGDCFWLLQPLSPRKTFLTKNIGKEQLIEEVQAFVND